MGSWGIQDALCAYMVGIVIMWGFQEWGVASGLTRPRAWVVFSASVLWPAFLVILIQVDRRQKSAQPINNPPEQSAVIDRPWQSVVLATMGANAGQFKSGPANPRWNEGQIVHSKGYRLLRIGTDHPLADTRGYAFEHLIVWCAAGRSKPEDGYLIHHKNAIKTDNRLDNLELSEWKHHTDEHNAQAKALADLPGYGPPKDNDRAPY